MTRNGCSPRTKMSLLTASFLEALHAIILFSTEQDEITFLCRNEIVFWAFLHVMIEKTHSTCVLSVRRISGTSSIPPSGT
ncbi:hypothetical protein DFH11DRAFT_1586063 [Phellopilus nigrolimitatus]|nr:hypothetical protein DFH11DRAFT_1586063 [Phellopilus nigrolimitatus]